MLARRFSLSLGLALTVSAAAHVAVIMPLLAMAMAGAHDGRAVVARFEPEDFRSRDEERPDQVEPEPPVALGIDARTPSRFTWVGYDEYEEHLAALAEVEQAAFTDDPGFQISNLESQISDPAPESPAAEPLPAPVESAASSADAPTEIAAAETNALDAVSSETIEVAAIEAATPEDASAAPDQQQRSGSAADFLEMLARLMPVPQREAAATESNPAAPHRAVGTAASSAESGARSDRESDPSSTIEAPPETWRLGKPLAAHGLELKPRRPRFTELTLLTAWPRDPTAQLVFGRDGVPVRAELLEKTGDSRVDEALIASLYRWRAAGAPLTKLVKDETIEVRIKLLLHAR